jgi:hypothetical protein
LEEKKDSDTDENEAVTEQVMPDEAVEAKKKRPKRLLQRRRRPGAGFFRSLEAQKKMKKAAKTALSAPTSTPNSADKL